ncbi:hypothetical protein C0Q70_09025, partial [Pomacea canaliculata]
NTNRNSSKQGGRLQVIANFFQNLAPTRRGSQSQNTQQSDSPVPPEQSTSHTDLLPPISSSHLIASKSHNTSYASHAYLSSPRDLSPGQKNSIVITNSPSPIRRTVEQFREDVLRAKESGNWQPVLDFYSAAFDSFIELNKTFKKDPEKEYKTAENHGIQIEFVNTVYDSLMKVPNEVSKETLKAIINCLLKDKRPHGKDDLRAYLILLQNPQFSSLSAYVIFAHLLRQIASLSDHDHHFLVHWIKQLQKDRFRGILERLHNFIACRLFPPNPEDLPSLGKCTWWIPSATKVMALFNAANNLTSPVPLVPHTDFYNSTLDHLDLMAEYYAWQNPSSHAGFSFCQYPFILSIAAKRMILQKDSEQQMIIQARRSLVAKVQRRQLPDVGMLFLNLTVRRSHLVSDSLNEIAHKQHDLKKKLKVSFAGEPGLDMGGLTKEWFLLLIRKIFHQEYGMFTYDKRAGVHWFSLAPCENYQEFNLVGVISFHILMGLAVYNSINLDVRFPSVCYRKLLSPAVVPFHNPRATVGVTTSSLDDLKKMMPDVARGLQDLLEYDGNVEEDFELSFQMLRPEEVEMLVCGNPTLVMSELKKVTIYDGYFWDVVLHLPLEMQKKLLLFATGSDRVPIGGMGEMTFKISRINDPDLLPMSHTCFNQLVLPPYKTRKILKHKILTAIQNAEGFGLE